MVKMEIPYLRDDLLDHKAYIAKLREDMPEIRNWQWGDPM
jgi:phosphoketolase